MKLKISYTYATVTPESAKEGDFAETGWAYWNGFNFEQGGPNYNDEHTEVIDVNIKQELIDFLEERYCTEPSCYPAPGNIDETCWYSTPDPDTDLHTGAETTYSAHIEVINK